MKKIYLILIALITLSSLQSCEKDDKRGDNFEPRPLMFYFMVDKNSKEYQDLKNEFAKNDYTKSPREKRGFNNVYLSKGNKIIKFLKGLSSYNKGETYNDYTYILYHLMKISDNYAFLCLGAYYKELHKEVLTSKEESLVLVYGNKKMQLKIKGKLFDVGTAAVDKFYVNGKERKFISAFKEEDNRGTRDIVFYLTD